MKAVEDYIAKHYQPSSRVAYVYGVRLFMDWIGVEKASVATYSDIVDYLNYLRRGERKARTLNNYLFAVKIYYHYLRDAGQRADHPCERLQLKDQYDRAIHLEKLYSPEQLQQLEQREWRKSKKLVSRNRVIVSLLIHQALMVSEITTLQVGSVDLKTGWIAVEASALNRARRLPLQSSQILLLHEYIQVHRPKMDHPQLILNYGGQPLHPHAISRIINGKRPAADRFLPLRIRQSVIASLLKSGHDLRLVQTFAGHRQISTTEAYRQTELDELRASIEKHHPLQ
ncbi:MAG: tyrosine-type recombinase/integrase [Bacteroidota bacterium]